jgi:DHA1 family multidrug resistance protein-like MFS transporter
LNFVNSGFNSLVSVYFLRAFGATPLQIAGVLVVVGVMSVIVQAGFIDRLVKRFGERNLAVTGMVFQAIQVAGTVFVPGFWMMYIFQGITSGGAGTVRPSMSALLSNRVSSREQGKLNGVSTSLNSLMGVFGPLAAGLTYDHVSPHAPFLIGGGILLLTATWIWFSEKSSSETQSEP